MKLPLNWLQDFCDVSDIDPKAYCDAMTDTGSKVEGYEVLGEDVQHVVVGKILNIEKHPDADKLQICSVDVGGEKPLQIVTGAQNVFVGAEVPVALSGAKLPGGITIKTGKLRGIVSEGMLCSIAELGLTLHDMPYAIEDGILILNSEAGDYQPGADIKKALGCSDVVVEFEITPNRPDCLSVIGLARESGVTFHRAVNYHTPKISAEDSTDSIHNYLDVELRNTELCPRYTTRVIKNVKIAPSPRWMRMRLRAAGVRPINNIVDITNYVMLEYGQPMHAFDYRCLDGKKIIIRSAEEGENFRSLDDNDHKLSASMLVIADEKKAVALAGVMGGANSEIQDSTTTVVFESANFVGSSVRTTSRALGMRTESSARFEKGLDSDQTQAALTRACELVEMLGAGTVVSGEIDVYARPKDKRFVVLNAEQINRFLGVNLEESYMKQILRDLDFEVEGDRIYVPSFRDDVECMNDIAEEIIRIYGYNTIQSTLFYSKIKEGMLTPKQKFIKELHNLLCAMGLYEAYTFSFISPKYYDKIRLAPKDARRSCVTIKNPLGEDTSVMRTTALPSVLEVAARNESFGAETLKIYEMATVYIPNSDPAKLPDEKLQLVIADLCQDHSEKAFFRIKGITEAIHAFAGVQGEYTAQTEDPSFHPGRCAVYTADGKTITTLGQIHPEVLENYSVSSNVCAAVIDVEALFALRKNDAVQYTPLPKFPASTRDLALVCDEAVTVGEIEKCMFASGGKLLCDVKFFDAYRSLQIGIGKKSLAFNLTLRAADRTLTDEEVEQCVSKILKALSQNCGATLRA